MPRNYTAKRPTPNKDDLAAAVAAVNSGELRLREAATQYNIDKSTLSRRLSKGDPATSSGGQLSLPRESELELTECLKVKSKWGFAESIEELKEHVKTYVNSNINEDNEVGNHLRKYCKLRDNRPGKDWVISFMERHHLSVKCPSALEKARKTAASNPDIIYQYYSTLEKETIRLRIVHRPECVWNIDETSLFIDPRKLKVIASKGQKASRTQATSGREATTVMAGISAAGECLPPLIIFKGQKLQSTWRSPNAYKGTQYACSESGWMVSEIFYDWFKYFCLTITQRPLLLVYDGHSTHLTSAVILQARSENITIVKLPPHTTDKLQPLDVVCFKPLKTQWDKAISTWTKDNNARRITKPEFVSLVGSVWDKVFTHDIIVKSFEKTGLYPVDRTVYPESEFKPNLLTLYKRIQSLEVPPAVTPRPATPRKPTPPPTPLTSTPSNSTNLPCARSLGDSFEQIMADRATTSTYIRAPDPEAPPVQTAKRRRIDPQSRVITDEAFLEDILKVEELRARKDTRKGKQQQKSKPPPAAPQDEQEEPSEEESSDDECAPFLQFSSRIYENLKPKRHEYYAVGYRNTSYIGCVEDVRNDETVTMKFLIMKDNDRYDLPSITRNNSENVPLDNIYCGPIKLVKTVPFTIYGVTKAFKDYKQHLKEAKEKISG
jgi:hypothetical protein